MTLLMPDIGAALGQTLLGGLGAVGNPQRVPMYFTSTARLRLLNETLERGQAITLAEIQNFSQQITDVTFGQQVITGDIAKGTPRNVLPIIKMAVNPNSISWRQPKRIVKRDTRNGSIYFHFSNEKGQNNDILTMDFRGNTGNIDPRGSANVNQGVFSTVSDTPDTNTNAIAKQIIWHNLWSLTREPMLLPDNTINVFQIFYSSPIIPIQIQLRGFFTNVLDWTDSADKPFSKDYSFGFTVQETIPPLDDLVPLIQQSAFAPEVEA
jgi:hypothetical protein